MKEITFDQIKRLRFEDILWLIFVFLAFINIYGDELQIKFLNTNNKNLEKKANDAFTFTLIVTFFIYIYFFLRNYNAFKNVSAKQKSLLTIKVLGSALLIAGIICLIYFQRKNSTFIGSPSI